MIASLIFSVALTPPPDQVQFPNLDEVVAQEPPRPVLPNRPTVPTVPIIPRRPDLGPNLPLPEVPAGLETECLVSVGGRYVGGGLAGTALLDGISAAVTYCPLGDLSAIVPQLPGGGGWWMGYPDIEVHVTFEIGDAITHVIDTRLMPGGADISIINAHDPADPNPPPGAQAGQDRDVVSLSQFQPRTRAGEHLTPSSGGKAYIIHYHMLPAYGGRDSFVQVDLPSVLAALPGMTPAPVLVTTQHFSGARLPDGSPAYDYVTGDVQADSYRWETRRIPDLADLLRPR